MGRVKNLTLEDEIAESIAKEMQKEIDTEVMISMLQEHGWHLIVLESLASMKQSIDITTWLEDNRTDEVFRWGRKFVFKKQEDAVLFSLRWLQ